MVNSLLVSSQYVLEVLPHYIKLKTIDATSFQSRIKLNFENANFEVKTATSLNELNEVLKLRFEVFQKEFSGKSMSYSPLKYDIDAFDFKCDHLIVKDKVSGCIVATYRLLAANQSHQVGKFYSESEFYLSEFLNLPGHKLELGRACVSRNFRNGEVISLLWKGLCSYAKKADVRYMFGCSSIPHEQFGKLAEIKNELYERKAFLNDYSVTARPEYAMPKILPQKAGSLAKDSTLGSLMNMYLLAGARMFPGFAYDREMNCIDVFTVVDMEKMPGSFIRRFAC